MDCSLPGIFQARVLEWVAIAFSRRSSPPRDRTQVSSIVDECFTVWATREVLGPLNRLYGWSLNWYDWSPSKKWSPGLREALKDGHVMTQGEDSCLQAKENSQEKATLPTPWPQSVSLQSCEKINVCGLIHPDCGSLFWWAETTSAAEKAAARPLC